MVYNWKEVLKFIYINNKFCKFIYIILKDFIFFVFYFSMRCSNKWLINGFGILIVWLVIVCLCLYCIWEDNCVVVMNLCYFGYIEWLLF